MQKQEELQDQQEEDKQEEGRELIFYRIWVQK